MFSVTRLCFGGTIARAVVPDKRVTAVERPGCPVLGHVEHHRIPPNHVRELVPHLAPGERKVSDPLLRPGPLLRGPCLDRLSDSLSVGQKALGGYLLRLVSRAAEYLSGAL